ncbi:MAG: hypothetical protein ACOY90_05820 [Candidatus Zhuqueibacterota bacterium]
MIKINFLQKQSLKKKSKRIKLIITISYICIWLFSLYMIFQSYQVNRFIKVTYEQDASRIERDIRKIQPNMERLKNLFLTIQEYKQGLQAIEENTMSPLVLADKLFSVAKIVPERIWLEEMSLEGEKPKKQAAKAQSAVRKFTIRGAYFLQSSHPDLHYLNAFNDLLQQRGVFSDYVENLSIVSSEISNVRNQPAVSFQMEGNWIYANSTAGY